MNFKDQYKARLANLDKLEVLIRENTEQICSALKKDLNKHPLEALTSEVGMVLEELTYHRKNLKKWMRPQKTNFHLASFPSRSRIIYEAKGQVLIIGPWNYPFQLVFLPLVGALSAGNQVVIKPSEYASATASLTTTLLEKYFPKDQIQVVNGGVSETTELLKQRFDHIFFTGSTAVGKIVMKAAAEHLTPVTLELGGKSPCVVTAKSDLELAARRIVWGKFYNAGQTCIAPDYVLAEESVASDLIQLLKREIQQQYGEQPKISSDFGRIINESHAQRLQGLLRGATVVYGGEIDGLYISPTLLHPVSWQHPVMQQEIFGPILPILSFSRLDQALDQIKNQEKPLAAYLFSNDFQEQSQFLQDLSFGGGCINDTLLHLSHPQLPFGGIGASGMGSYHGFKSFETFSHAKSVLIRGGFMDWNLRYPPYDEKKLKFFRKFLGF